LRIFLVGLICQVAVACAAPATPAAAAPPSAATPSQAAEAIGAIVRDEIANGKVPGAVVVLGIGDRIVVRQAYGNRSVMPSVQPATLDTIYDAASLTKVMATSVAIMQLVERGQIDLDRPAAAYWPAFAANGKGDITVRELRDCLPRELVELRLSRDTSPGGLLAVVVLVVARGGVPLVVGRNDPVAEAVDSTGPMVDSCNRVRLNQILRGVSDVIDHAQIRLQDRLLIPEPGREAELVAIRGAPRRSSARSLATSTTYENGLVR